MTDDTEKLKLRLRRGGGPIGVGGGPIYCSFCDKREDEHKKVVASLSALICDKCVSMIARMMEEDEKHGEEEDRHG